MIRWVATLSVSLLFLSAASASLDRKERPADPSLIPLKSLLSSPANPDSKDEYRVTDKTEVLLDGRPCRYEQIPNSATIILLETVTNESKEISRIHFRSGRRPTSPTSK